MLGTTEVLDKLIAGHISDFDLRKSLQEEEVEKLRLELSEERGHNVSENLQLEFEVGCPAHLHRLGTLTSRA